MMRVLSRTTTGSGWTASQWLNCKSVGTVRYSPGPVLLSRLEQLKLNAVRNGSMARIGALLLYPLMNSCRLP